jgi:hypothetical protein
MSAPIIQQSVRVIAKSTSNHTNKLVNIVTSTVGDVHHAIKTYLQLTAVQAKVGIHHTFQDSGGSIKGLPTICIVGYTGPN